MSYLVSIKRSARRSNGEAGRIVNERGSTQSFDSRADADRWARLLSFEGDATVWVQDAPPHDRTDADGYLVGWRDSMYRTMIRRGTRKTYRSSSSQGDESAAGEQTELIEQSQ